MIATQSTFELEHVIQALLEGNICFADRMKIIDREIQRLSPELAEKVDRYVDRLESAGAGSTAPQTGEPMPPFLLPDDQGRLVALVELLETAPIIIVLIRGYLCPYCRLVVAELAGMERKIAPVRLAIISPEARHFSRKIKSEAAASFPILTDVDCGYTMMLDLAAWDGDMPPLIADSEDTRTNDKSSAVRLLPIPAIFVVDQVGIIRARQVDLDYRCRMEPGELKMIVSQIL